jgi:hypothetical protein
MMQAAMTDFYSAHRIAEINNAEPLFTCPGLSQRTPSEKPGLSEFLALF